MFPQTTNPTKNSHPFFPRKIFPSLDLRKTPSSFRYVAPVDEAAIAAASQRGPRQGVGVAAGDGAEEGIDLAVVNG